LTRLQHLLPFKDSSGHVLEIDQSAAERFALESAMDETEGIPLTGVDLCFACRRSNEAGLAKYQGEPHNIALESIDAHKM
jgi:hypothetical protein